MILTTKVKAKTVTVFKIAMKWFLKMEGFERRSVWLWSATMATGMKETTIELSIMDW